MNSKTLIEVIGEIREWISLPLLRVGYWLGLFVCFDFLVVILIRWDSVCDGETDRRCWREWEEEEGWAYLCFVLLREKEEKRVYLNPAIQHFSTTLLFAFTNLSFSKLLLLQLLFHLSFH